MASRLSAPRTKPGMKVPACLPCCLDWIARGAGPAAVSLYGPWGFCRLHPVLARQQVINAQHCCAGCSLGLTKWPMLLLSAYVAPGRVAACTLVDSSALSKAVS